MVDADDVLVIAAKGGDREAWGELVRRHAAPLAAYLGARLRRVEVIDKLVGDVVVNGWLTLGSLAPGEEVGAWFRRQGAGLAKRWRQEHPDDQLDVGLPPARLPAEASLADDLRRLDAAIATLDDQERMAIEQRWRGRQDLAGVARIMRVSEEQVRVLLDRALTKLGAQV